MNAGLRNRLVLAAAAAAFTALGRPAGADTVGATPTSFTYQGELVQGGTPVEGVVDLAFSLWDAAVGGAQIGVTSTCDDVQVMAGRFTATVDLGASVFDGAARWLEISVDGSPLSPRQRVTGAPYSLSTRGMTVEDDDDVSIVDRIFVDDARQFIGVNRSQQVSLEEFFGVAAPVQTGFGGMYVRTDGADARPFYGYSAAGDISAYHYYDPEAAMWKLYVDGDRLFVGDDGFVGVNRDTPLSSSEYFGVDAPVQNGYGGMYVNTAGAEALPFYGYGHGGDIGAFHYFDPGDSEWRLFGGGMRLAVNTGDGNVGFGVSNPAFPIEMVSGAVCTAGGTWVNASSETLKENFESIDGVEVLERLVALPISRWNYRVEDDGVQHLGPTAEAFQAAFGLGHADDSIATVDADGVALAAIQGLHELLDSKTQRIEELAAENTELRDLMTTLAQRLDDLERSNP